MLLFAVIRWNRDYFFVSKQLCKHVLPQLIHNSSGYMKNICCSLISKIQELDDCYHIHSKHGLKSPEWWKAVIWHSDEAASLCHHQLLKPEWAIMFVLKWTLLVVIKCHRRAAFPFMSSFWCSDRKCLLAINKITIQFHQWRAKDFILSFFNLFFTHGCKDDPSIMTEMYSYKKILQNMCGLQTFYMRRTKCKEKHTVNNN